RYRSPGGRAPPHDDRERCAALSRTETGGPAEGTRDGDCLRGRKHAPGGLRPRPGGGGVGAGPRAATRRAGIRAGGVSRRARALAFLTAAVLCAILAAAVAGSYPAGGEGADGAAAPA